LGDTSVLLPLLALFVLGRPQAWAATLAAVPAGALFSTLGKHWASVPRPAAVLDPSLFNLIGPALHNQSFPSGHTITAFAAAAAVLATLSPSPRRGRDWMLLLAGLLLAVTVALSRVAVGAHWPLDLAAGASGGWLAGLSGAALARRVGWWQWLVCGAGRRAAGAGFILWGLLLWFRPHDTLSSAVVLGVAGLCGVGTGLCLLFRRSTGPKSPIAASVAPS
jgi:membrane-associated phospholipid phosphatase